MDDIIVKPKVRLDFAHFEAFRDARPKLEKWELIDGELIMMPPPRVIHQRIADNLRGMPLAQIDLSQPTWHADREIGVHIPEDDSYAPQPDVTVIDRDVPLGLVYAERFYLVVEVLSRDRPDVLEKKRGYYMAPEHCRGFLFVSQKELAAEFVARTDRGWRTQTLTDPDAIIDIPDIGRIGTLRQAYHATPLTPPSKAGT